MKIKLILVISILIHNIVCSDPQKIALVLSGGGAKGIAQIPTLSLIDSLQVSHKTVGQAVLTTSITIAFGFSVLCLSNFIPTILFGLFTSLAMIIAMLGVLISLPTILYYIKL